MCQGRNVLKAYKNVGEETYSNSSLEKAKAYFRRRAVLRCARTFSYSTAQIDV